MKKAVFISILIIGILIFQVSILLFVANSNVLGASTCEQYCNSRQYDPTTGTWHYTETEPVGTVCVCPSPHKDLIDILRQIIKAVFLISIPLTSLMIIIGAYYIVTSGGVPDRVKKGKSIIIWTLVGFTVILLSEAIIGVIKAIIGS